MENNFNEPLSLDYCYDAVVDLMVVSVVAAVGIVVVAVGIVVAVAVVDTVVGFLHPHIHPRLALVKLHSKHLPILRV